MAVDYTKIQELLGQEAETLLGHVSKTIPKADIHLPGGDFVDRVWMQSDRTPGVLRSLQTLTDHGRLAGTGYLSVLPVDQGIEHSAGASFAPNPQYFDPENFRHVRTDYSRTVYASEQRRIAGGGAGLPPPQNQQASPTRIEAYEEFADFKEESGLTVPHTYKFHLAIQSEVRPAVVDWVFNLSQYSFTSPLDAAEFTFGHEKK